METSVLECILFIEGKFDETQSFRSTRGNHAMLLVFKVRNVTLYSSTRLTAAAKQSFFKNFYPNQGVRI